MHTQEYIRKEVMELFYEAFFFLFLFLCENGTKSSAILLWHLQLNNFCSLQFYNFCDITSYNMQIFKIFTASVFATIEVLFSFLFYEKKTPELIHQQFIYWHFITLPFKLVYVTESAVFSFYPSVATLGYLILTITKGKDEDNKLFPQGSWAIPFFDVEHLKLMTKT